MRIFHSIFGRGEQPTRYPEALIEQAIERAVEGTDSRLHLLASYRKRLREPVMAAIDHVIALTDALTMPVKADLSGYAQEPRLAALFASPTAMLDSLARTPAIKILLRSVPVLADTEVFALLTALCSERHVLGMELIEDQVRHDVAQVSVSFSGHRLLDPTADWNEHLRQLKRRAFDHLLHLVLAQMTERQEQCAELMGERDLLRRKQQALAAGVWPFARHQDSGAEEDPSALQTHLDRVSAELHACATGQDTLHAHLDLLANGLLHASERMRIDQVIWWLDAMNIRRKPEQSGARELRFEELRDSQGQRLTLLPLRLRLADLPRPEDLVSAAERYL